MAIANLKTSDSEEILNLNALTTVQILFSLRSLILDCYKPYPIAVAIKFKLYLTRSYFHVTFQSNQPIFHLV